MRTRFIQKISRYVPRAVILAVLSAGVLQACAGPAHPIRPACDRCRIVCGECEEQDRFVRLQGPSQGLFQARTPTFSHPATLSPEDWKVILSTVRIRRQGESVLFFSLPKGMIGNAFTPEEIDYLSRALSQGFAKAQPTEWVVFGLTRARGSELSELISGGWCMEGAQLRLLLANYRYAVTTSALRELVWENPLSSQVSGYELVPGDHQKVIDKDDGLLSSTADELLIAYQPLLREDSLPVSAQPDGVGSSLLPQEASDPRPVEDRLKTLKRLRDQGLITEDEYLRKRSRLLERL